MDQQKKPGGKDISDLKARLGLKNQPGAAPAPAAGAPSRPGAGPVVAPPGAPAPAPKPMVPGAPGPLPPGASAPGPAPAPAPAAAPAHDPFAGMKPKQGQMFDIRMIDDGKPVESVQAKGGKGGMVITAILALIAFGVGGGFGMSAVGRKDFNNTNNAAKVVKNELDAMNKILNKVTEAVQLSAQRLQAEKKDTLSYDEKLIADFEQIKLDPRPDTNKIFRVNYYHLSDIAVDRLMNYYFDSQMLYGEVERHVKRTKADAESLKAFFEKQGGPDKPQANYGVVFDTSNAKLTVANLVEVGEQVCKGGGKDCTAADLEGFKVRMNTGSNWYPKKLSKNDADRVVPIKPTPLMDAVMSGSPDQVRAEAYKQRVANIRGIVGRIKNGQKELTDELDKAANRPDLFTLF